MHDRDRFPTPPETGAKAEETGLAASLRRLRYADPPPELRRRTLARAAEALGAGEKPRPADWWRELALAGAALALFALSRPPAAPAPAESKAPAARRELAEVLEPHGELAAYLEKRQLAAAAADRSAPRLRPSLATY